MGQLFQGDICPICKAKSARKDQCGTARNHLNLWTERRSTDKVRARFGRCNLGWSSLPILTSKSKPLIARSSFGRCKRSPIRDSAAILCLHG